MTFRFLSLFALSATLFSCVTSTSDFCEAREGTYSIKIALDKAQSSRCGAGGEVPFDLTGRGYEDTLTFLKGCPAVSVNRSADQCKVTFSDTGCVPDATVSLDYSGSYTWNSTSEAATGSLTTTSRGTGASATPITCQYTLTIAR